MTMPSPHFDVQAPDLQFGSAWQLEEQPSNGKMLPSSQLSLPSFFLSPQVVALHVLGWPLHLKPISSLHLLEQPSPSLALPSSHSSVAATMPSPQRAIA